MRNQILEHRQHLIARESAITPVKKQRYWLRDKMGKALLSQNQTAGGVVQVQHFPPREKDDPNLPPTFHIAPPGKNFMHPASRAEILDRLANFPEGLQKMIRKRLHHIVLPMHTRKHEQVPLYGMQWEASVYLFPIEEDGVEPFSTPPSPLLFQETHKFGARWSYDSQKERWLCTWTPASLRDFYLENILCHEIGHVLDERNSSFNDRERYANDFATQYGKAPELYPGRKKSHDERKNRRHNK